MKDLPLFRFLAFAGKIIFLGHFAVPTFAQDAEKVSELQRVIAAQQKQMEAQQKQLDAQRQLLENLQRQMESLAKDKTTKDKTTVVQTPAPAPEVAHHPVADNENAVTTNAGSASSTVSPQTGGRYEALNDANFPKSTPLFGSDWRFSFGGYVKLDVITDFAGTGDKFQFTTATIPVPGASNSPPRGGYTSLHGRESRFAFDLRKSSQDDPFTKVFFEFDFFDESTTSPRLRHAYFQYGNLTAGQTWTTLSEVRSLPFLVDFSYGDALYGGRANLVRWNQRVNDRFDWAVGLEDFNAGAIENPNALNGTARSWAPLLATRATYDAGRALFTLGGSLAQLRWDGGGVVSDADALQWALVFGTRIYLDSDRRHYFGLNSSYGDGSAGNIISLAEGNVPGGVLGPDGSLHTLKAWNLAPNVQFKLTPKLSTNLAYAMAQVESSPLREPDAMKGDTAWHVNLIYDFTKELRLGAEYMYGTRENVNGAEGDANRTQFMMMYTY